ncbi:MAG: hypothetical protein C0482_07575 [Gordonia sp.]|jgi:uncharacterized protein involved in exopolysaccharide biosynthesis|nr:hypothetical protein [Gordonia sp. (in: high G+C Gram-positive bacteria)]OZG29962.1 hypothetical protein BH683_006110 [Williamsia sp. 1138]
MEVNVSDEPLTAEERAELKRLRAQNDALAKKLEQNEKALEIMETARQKLLRLRGESDSEGDTR